MGVRYWPPNIPREATVAAFEEAIRFFGFAECASRALEKNLEKVALFCMGGVPTHFARQLPKGKWSSKLGEAEDIEHELIALEGPQYGTLHAVYSRAKR